MNEVLPGYHSKSIDTCRWVVDNFGDKIGENKTLELWVEQSRLVLLQEEFVEA